ncbi:phosphotransferase family protein [Anaerocaecibacter muris]|uniref:phosphotransferase family protein n=1 Tax=Anaerocaecibacter muris TaxID=2941513 RepID=UPI00203E9EF8|nr:aminoglycoside phosphotransferase family protein [Anaerocaecibacter muris]
MNEIAKRPNKAVYRDGDLCYKVFAADYKKSDIFNEALNQTRVEETGLFIPKVHEVKKLDDGRLAIVMDYVEGKSLATLIAENPAKRLEYVTRLIDIQLSMHSLTSPELNKQRAKFDRKIDLSGLDATTRYELHVRLGGMPKHNKLCHGDFNPSNVIITNDDRACVIDWSHATVGNASADTARTYLLFKLAGDDKTAEDYMTLFCKKSDTARQYVDQWLPIVAASQMAKGKPHEREMLGKWVDVCQYE